MFFFPDPETALREMARVTAPGGVVAIQTYAALDEQPGYRPFVETVVRHAGEAARGPVSTYWTWGLEVLGDALDRAGLEVLRSGPRLGAAHFGSVEQLVAVEIDGTPLAGLVTAQQRAAILDELRDVLRDHLTEDGALPLPVRAALVAAALATGRDVGHRVDPRT